MNYKQKYLDALKGLRSYRIMMIVLVVVGAIGILPKMDLFWGYYFAITFFCVGLIESIKRFLSIKKEINYLEMQL